MSAPRRQPGPRPSFAERAAASARQRRFPRALRIAPGDPPVDLDVLVAALTSHLGSNGAGPEGRRGQQQQLQLQPNDPPDDRHIGDDHDAPDEPQTGAPVTDDPATDDPGGLGGLRGLGDAENDALFDSRALASLATGLWRARRRMLVPGTDEPRAELRPVFRHLQSVWDTLTGAGVAIQDHDGQPFESGLALEVLTFQPTPGLQGEAVVETVRPSVYVRDRVVQLGQVIVGIPEAEGDPR